MKARRIRSYVRRDGRKTPAQEHARTQFWPQFGLELETGLLNLEQVFGRHAPCFLEIGFGYGQSLLELAKSHPEWDFIGIETHRPGLGALLLGIETNNLTNLRLFQDDAVDVLAQCIADLSLSGVNIFFPDPWPKRRHHPRRLIQPIFINELAKKLKPGGLLHLATDWEDYAKQMLNVIQSSGKFKNLADAAYAVSRSSFRPVVTKFERRAQTANHRIWELQFISK